MAYSHNDSLTLLGTCNIRTKDTWFGPMLHKEHDDEDLDLLRSGNKAAFTRVVQRYHRPMLVIARAIAGDTWAEEVLQEAWISIHRALPRFEGRSSLQTWLYT